jgi:hypothetical protein
MKMVWDERDPGGVPDGRDVDQLAAQLGDRLHADPGLDLDDDLQRAVVVLAIEDKLRLRRG